MAGQNLNAASRSAQLNAVRNMGTNTSQFSTQLTAVEEAMGSFIIRVKANIQAKNMHVTGNIENMHVAQINDKIVIMGSPYVSFQDLGVKGKESSALAPNSPFQFSDKMPPQYVFKDLIVRKNLNLRNNPLYLGNPSTYANLTDEQLQNKAAWGMAVNTYKNGFKPQNFFNVEIPELIRDLTTNITGFLTGQLIQATDVRHTNRP